MQTIRRPSAPGQRRPFRSLRPGVRLAAIAAVLCQAGAAHALQWQWRFERPASEPYGPILALGVLSTSDSPDGSGYFTILTANGSRNGVAIEELLPIGSSIPGNAAYTSDNLLREGSVPMTSQGFNVRFADGSFSNFFTATYLSPVQDREFHSLPPAFATLPETELSGLFQARPIRVPAPLPAVGVGLALAWSRRLRRRR
jgi:hypothetical protein